MTAREYLNQIRLLDVKIRQKREERAYLQSIASGNKSQVLNADKVQSSGSQSRMEDTVIRYTDLEQDIDRMIRQYIDMRDHIINQIHQLEEAKYVELLQYKYVGVPRGEDGRIEYLRLEEIACIMKKSNGMPYSYQHIKSLHGEALKEFSRVILL